MVMAAPPPPQQTVTLTSMLKVMTPRRSTAPCSGVCRNSITRRCAAAPVGYRALQQFPIFLGWIEPHLPHHGTGQLCWDSHDIDNLGIEWETAVKGGQPPNIWSNLSIWRSDLAPAVIGRLAAAKASNCSAHQRCCV